MLLQLLTVATRQEQMERHDCAWTCSWIGLKIPSPLRIPLEQVPDGIPKSRMRIPIRSGNSQPIGPLMSAPRKMRSYLRRFQCAALSHRCMRETT